MEFMLVRVPVAVILDEIMIFLEVSSKKSIFSA